MKHARISLLLTTLIGFPLGAVASTEYVPLPEHEAKHATAEAASDDYLSFLQADILKLRAEVAAANQARDAAISARQQAEAALAPLQQQLGAAQTEIQNLKSRIQNAQAALAAAAAAASRPLIGAKLDGNETAQMLASRDRFTAFVGRPPEFAMVFTSMEGWSTSAAQFIAADYWIQRATKLELPIVWVIGLCPKAPVANVNVLARDVIPGSKDAEFRRAAVALAALPSAARFKGKVPVRFGHEGNVDVSKQQQWYEWQDDPATFVAALKRVVGIFRSVSPDFEIVLSFNAASDDVRRWYPGPEWVDRLTVDWYSANTSFEVARDHPTAGFNAVAQLARANGHTFAFDEIGVAPNSGPTLDQFVTYVRAQADPSVEYVCWWDSTENPNTRISTGTAGTTGEAFRAAFGSGS